MTGFRGQVSALRREKCVNSSMNWSIMSLLALTAVDLGSGGSTSTLASTTESCPSLLQYHTVVCSWMATLPRRRGCRELSERTRHLSERVSPTVRLAVGIAVSFAAIGGQGGWLVFGLGRPARSMLWPPERSGLVQKRPKSQTITSGGPTYSQATSVTGDWRETAHLFPNNGRSQTHSWWVGLFRNEETS